MLGKKIAVAAVMVMFVAVAFFAANTRGEIEEQEIPNPVNEMIPTAGYIKFEGLEGGSQDEDHEGWSDLLGFSVGVSSEDDKPEGKQTGRRIHDTVKIVKFIDKTTPLVLKALCKEEVIEKMFIVTAGMWGGETEQDYFEYEMKDVIIIDHVVETEDVEGEVPVETITLSFSEMTVTYHETDENGKIMGSTEYTVDDDGGKKKGKK